MLAVHALVAEPPAESTGVRALFESILQWGVLQPLIVRATGSGLYQVLCGRKRYAAAASAGLDEVPCLIFEGSDQEAAALAATSNSVPGAAAAAAVPPSSALFAAILSELHATRGAIAGSLALADSKGSGLRQHVARELVQIELQRGSWLIDALLIFNSGGQEARGPVRVGPLLRAVADAFGAECRAGGIDVRLLVDPPDLAVMGNDAQLRAALDCIMGALLTSMHRSRNPAAVLTMEGRIASGVPILSIAQNVVPFQGLARIRGTRRGESEQGEAALSSFGIDAARRAVEAQGGRLELRPEAPHGGCAIDVKLPAAG
jgi:hypothetical protein